MPDKGPGGAVSKLTDPVRHGKIKYILAAARVYTGGCSGRYIDVGL